RWSGEAVDYYDFVRRRWQAEVHPRAAADTFQAFWDRSVQDGFAQLPAPPETATFDARALSGVRAPAGGGLELVLYQKVAVRDGAQANNGWLQELPDPISKVTWANYACLAPARARALGVTDGDLVTLECGGRSLTLPALLQPGVHADVVAVAVGYGRTRAGGVADGVGVNAYALAHADGKRAFRVPGATLTRAGGARALALSQTHASLEGRPHVQELSLPGLLAKTRGGPGAQAPAPAAHGSMWSGHAYEGHKWFMVVDLNACTGCSACVVSCQAENNIPVVGADEVQRRREMHWLRLDRYYAGDEDAPAVVHQPMLCQHCDNAPCESVCPVLATVHSSEGLNQQVYNRCVGTRYCANNCPTKTRRFNWFNYPHPDPVQRLVLNPDVVVRERGVMEKCSFCVQRITSGKAQAKREGRPLRDGDVRTACQQSCPADAIVFGDINDRESRVAKLAADGASYRVLPELNLGNAVAYLPVIRNGGEDADE
ncbi:MAG: 4Fe-4S dicluster domain-containing protein, partial [Myxococcales bacterium]